MSRIYALFIISKETLGIINIRNKYLKYMNVIIISIRLNFKEILIKQERIDIE